MLAETFSTLFIDPIYVGSHWYLLAAPLALAIAIVYKTLKVRHVKQVPASAVGLTVTILIGMAVAAAALYTLYRTFSWNWLG